MDAELEALIERARKLPPPTALERAVQRRTMIKSEFVHAHPEMPDAEVEALLDRVLGTLP